MIILRYTLLMVFIITLSLIYYLNQQIKTPNVIYIPQGSINKIISYLEHKQINVSQLDSYIMRFVGDPQSGWIDIGSSHMTRLDFLHKLSSSKAALQNVTLIPGETSYYFLKDISQKLGLDFKLIYEIYLKKAKYSEGMLVPDTYKVPIGISENDLITLLLNISNKKRKKFFNKIFGNYSELKMIRYVTIASIIQKEAANNEEMPLVSSVIYNRLKKGMKLQMDGTLNYGKYSHIKITSHRIKTDNSRYNTYKYKGLPPLPVCNVGTEALKAAIFPKKTDYLYFMKAKNGTHNFTRYYSTHIKNIRNATK